MNPVPTTVEGIMDLDVCRHGEVARRLGISETRVVQLRRAGKLAATLTPLGWGYHASSVEEYRKARARRLATRRPART